MASHARSFVPYRHTTTAQRQSGAMCPDEQRAAPAAERIGVGSASLQRWDLLCAHAEERPAEGIGVRHHRSCCVNRRGVTIHDREFTTRATRTNTVRTRIHRPEMFNVFNHPNLANPTQAKLIPANPNNFVVNTFVLVNRTSSTRLIQLAIRVEF